MREAYCVVWQTPDVAERRRYFALERQAQDLIDALKSAAEVVAVPFVVGPYRMAIEIENPALIARPS